MMQLALANQGTSHTDKCLLLHLAGINSTGNFVRLVTINWNDNFFNMSFPVIGGSETLYTTEPLMW